MCGCSILCLSWIRQSGLAVATCSNTSGKAGSQVQAGTTRLLNSVLNYHLLLQTFFLKHWASNCNWKTEEILLWSLCNSIWLFFLILSSIDCLQLIQKEDKEKIEGRKNGMVWSLELKLLDIWRISSVMKHSSLRMTFTCFFSNGNTDSHNKPTIINHGSQALSSLLICKVRHSCLHSTL